MKKMTQTMNDAWQKKKSMYFGPFNLAFRLGGLIRKLFHVQKSHLKINNVSFDLRFLEPVFNSTIFGTHRT